MKSDQDMHPGSGIIRVTGYSILGIYFLLVIFGIISWMSPRWLKDVSATGQTAEAIIMKNYGDNFLTLKEFDKAILQYNKALSIDPGLPEAYVNLGVALRGVGNNEDAIRNFNKASTFNTILHDVIYYNLAEIYLQQGKPNEAIEYFLKSAEIAPFPVASYQKAGELLNNQQQWDRAREVFDKALANIYTIKNCFTGMLKRDLYVYPDTLVKEEIRKLLAKGAEHYDMSPYDEKAFEDALKKDGQLAGIYNQYGYIYAMNGDFENAIRYFSAAVQIRPDFQNARNNLNAAYAQMKKKQSREGM